MDRNPPNKAPKPTDKVWFPQVYNQLPSSLHPQPERKPEPSSFSYLQYKSSRKLRSQPKPNPFDHLPSPFYPPIILQSSDPQPISFSIMLIGDSSVGKTNICTKLARDQFSHKHRPTPNPHRTQVFKPCHGEQIQINILEVPRKYFIKESPINLKNKDFVVIVFDVTKKASFMSAVGGWLEVAKKHVPERCRIMLLGNKVDMKGKRVVTEERGREVAEEQGVMYEQISAKQAERVPKFIVKLAEIKMIERDRELDK